MRAWEELLDSLKKELGEEVVNKWLSPLKIIRFDACNLYLEAKDSFAAMWFEEHVRHRLDQFFNNNKKLIKVHLSLLHETPKENSRVDSKKEPLSKWSFDVLNPHFTFENFETFEGNLMATRLLDECSKQKPDKTLTFNPVYLFGRKGCGKTHLLEAACHKMRKEGLNAVYVRAETFTEHVVGAIRNGEMQSFRKCYRTLDALLIDDVEVFAKKGATQEELFHTFNSLHGEGKRLIFAASPSPKDLKFIEMRLISRFEWGIVIPLEMLNRDAMKNAILKRSSALNFALSDEIIEFLLKYFSGNMKSLMRAFDALILRSHLSETKLSLSEIKNLLSDLIQEEESLAITPLKIIRSVAEHYGIKMEDILSKAQSREIALPRQIAMFLCRSHLKLPFMKIGEIFSRDHSTVISSVRLIQKGFQEKTSEISSTLASITRKLEKN